jgi:hypothetical protein
MTFDELLDQAINLLRWRGRVTYRALKLQFRFDDEYLDVLKDELIDGQQLAVDEDGCVLVWAGPPLTPLAATASQVATSRPLLLDKSHILPMPNAVSSPRSSGTWWTGQPSPLTVRREVRFTRDSTIRFRLIQGWAVEWTPVWSHSLVWLRLIRRIFASP